MNEDNVADVYAEVEGPGTLDDVVISLVSPAVPSRKLYESHQHTQLQYVSSAVDTPFQGGVFKMKLVLPSDYPHSAPKGMPRPIYLFRLFLLAMQQQLSVLLRQGLQSGQLLFSDSLTTETCSPRRVFSHKDFPPKYSTAER
jgi:hypothetical protein